MRIGYDTLTEHPLQPSSAIVYLKRVLEGLSRIATDDEIYVFVSPANRHHFERLSASNVCLINCFVSNENIPLRVLIQQAYFPRLAWRYRLDVIHGLNQIPLFAGTATVVKTCTLHHHLTPAEFSEKQVPGRSALMWRARRVYRRVMHDGSVRRSTLVIANSEYTKRALVELLHVQAERIRVVYEAVDDDFGGVVDRTAARTYIGTRFGLIRDYILYVSNLWFYKNPDGAIRAFAELRRSFGDELDLVIAGPDDWRRVPGLTALAHDLGVDDRVRFVGRVSRADLINLYAAARVVFYPSLAETFGKPLVEAMKAGVPVVTSNVTSLPEIAGGAALLTDPADGAAMAGVLHRAATDETLRAELAARGLERGRLFSWDRVTEQTLAVCREAAARRKSKPRHRGQ